MNRNVLTTAVAVAAAFSVGLGWSWYTGGHNGGVAIVDLDEVAKQLGQSEAMGNSIRSTAGNLMATVSKAEQEANRQLQAYRAQLGEQPTQEQAQEYLKTQQSARLQLNQLRQQADQALSQHTQKLVSDFRSQAKPVAQRVAKEKGLTTIITANDAVVFAFDDAVNITSEVVAQMKAEMPAPVSSPAQAAAPAAAGTSPAPSAAAAQPASAGTAPAATPAREAAAPAASQPQ